MRKKTSAEKAAPGARTMALAVRLAAAPVQPTGHVDGLAPLRTA